MHQLSYWKNRHFQTYNANYKQGQKGTQNPCEKAQWKRFTKEKVKS